MASVLPSMARSSLHDMPASTGLKSRPTAAMLSVEPSKSATKLVMVAVTSGKTDQSLSVPENPCAEAEATMAAIAESRNILIEEVKECVWIQAKTAKVCDEHCTQGGYGWGSPPPSHGGGPPRPTATQRSRHSPIMTTAKRYKINCVCNCKGSRDTATCRCWIGLGVRCTNKC